MFVVKEVIEARKRLEQIGQERRVVIYPQLYNDINLILNFTDDMLAYLENGKNPMDSFEVICNW